MNIKKGYPVRISFLDNKMNINLFLNIQSASQERD